MISNKITPRQYAVALYEVAKGLSGAKAKEMIARLILILKKNNSLSQLGKIIAAYESYAKKEKGIRQAELFSAKPLSKEVRNRIYAILNKKNKTELKENIDETLLGGLIIQINDTLIDASFKKQLEKLSDKLK